MYRIQTLIKIINLAKVAYRSYFKQIVVLLLIGLIGGLLEGIGVNALIPMFSFVTDGAGTGDDTISRFIKYAFDFFQIDFRLRNILILIVALFVLKALATIVLDFIKFKITADYEKNTRVKLFRKTLLSRWSYLYKQKIGYLENVLSMDVRNSAAMLKELAEIAISVSSLAVYIFIAFNVSAQITVLTLLIGSVVLLIFKPFVSRTRKISGREVGLNKEVAHFINQSVLGLKTIKASAIFPKVAKIGGELFNNLRRLKIRKLMLKEATNSTIQPLSVIFISVVFALSYKLPDFSLASFMVIIYLINRMFYYIQKLQYMLHAMGENIPHVQTVINYEAEIDRQAENAAGQKGFNFAYSLDFEDVYFSYGEGRDVLRGVNFSLAKGEMIALIGSSGSGKTTIVDLILRLFEPTKNNIVLDGVDIREIKLNDWREQIGYVSQDIFLINGSVADNIRFYDEQISDQDIERAAEMANIYNFIESLPKKFDTKIGDRGLFLSGGQRQRLVLARVFARRPQLLILDEATSALDSESELAIQRVIEGIKGHMTIVVIAHRLSTVKRCDSILVLDQGKIVEQGSPVDLLANQQSYFYKVSNLAS